VSKSILIAILLVTNNSVAQTVNDKVLKKFLNDTEFRQYVIPSGEQCDTIRLIDTLNFFTEKIIVTSIGKIATVTDVFIRMDQLPQNSVELQNWKCSNLFVSIKSDKNRRFIVNYFHEPTNGLGFVEFKSKNDVIKLTKWSLRLFLSLE
jgi:hypothetical protein